MPSASLCDRAQEFYELGARGALFRAGWELRDRIGWTGGSDEHAPGEPPCPVGGRPWTSRLPLADPHAVADAVRERIPAQDLRRLTATADAAMHGRILCFGRWTADFGDPIDWHLNPRTGRRTELNANQRSTSAEAADTGDVKLTWEAARFPHAYHLARAAAFSPQHASRYAQVLAAQMQAFLEANPFGEGVHWGSGQEVAIRSRAWVFALDALCVRQSGSPAVSALVSQALLDGARFIAAHIQFARIAVNNNHLLAEALGLFAAGALLPESPDARRWGRLGRQILDQEAERQFYPDGGYIQQSHNYHRVVLTDLLWACAFARSVGDQPSPSWMQAMERSLEFLAAHLNPVNGWLPNYGGNDGAMPSVLSTCDFADFRPVLQTVSLAVRGERMFEPGPWDEMPAWFFGPGILDQPLSRADRVSVSFTTVGYHVLRGNDEACFATFRCGSLLDRFSQIDMLHLDVWWRGQNVLVDAGSFQYNGAPEWHDHFMRTGCHNTIELDGRDQMLHFRQFKVLYWTQAKLLRFDDDERWCLAEGEHDGYKRHRGRCVHRRSVLFLKDDVWVVVDTILGEGEHVARLHWLGGEGEWSPLAAGNGFVLHTGDGEFSVSVLDDRGAPLQGDVVAGQDRPPRGWLSRYYGEKVPVPSCAVTSSGAVPRTFVSVLAGAPYQLAIKDQTWTLDIGEATAVFRLDEGRFVAVSVS